MVVPAVALDLLKLPGCVRKLGHFSPSNPRRCQLRDVAGGWREDEPEQPGLVLDDIWPARDIPREPCASWDVNIAMPFAKVAKYFSR